MSALSKDNLATETYHSFLQYFTLQELSAIRKVNKAFDGATISLLTRRMGAMCSQFLGTTVTADMLYKLMHRTDTVITGSAAIWFACPNYSSVPTHLNFVVPRSYWRTGSNEVAEFFFNLGYVYRTSTVIAFTDLRKMDLRTA